MSVISATSQSILVSCHPNATSRPPSYGPYASDAVEHLGVTYPQKPSQQRAPGASEGLAEVEPEVGVHHEGEQRAGTKVCMHRTAELRVLHGDADRRLRQQ